MTNRWCVTARITKQFMRTAALLLRDSRTGKTRYNLHLTSSLKNQQKYNCLRKSCLRKSRNVYITNRSRFSPM